jgi:hypothetical protein
MNTLGGQIMEQSKMLYSTGLFYKLQTVDIPRTMILPEKAAGPEYHIIEYITYVDRWARVKVKHENLVTYDCVLIDAAYFAANILRPKNFIIIRKFLNSHIICSHIIEMLEKTKFPWSPYKHFEKKLKDIMS